MNPNPFPAFSRPNSNIQKAGNKGTLCVLILDESGSMAGLEDDTIGGVNAFVQSQKRDDDGTLISVITFEGGSVRTQFDNVPVENMPEFNHSHYQPRGSTNLLDAIGKAVNNVNSALSLLPESERPSIIFQVMTDGHENSSRSFNRSQIKALIDAAQESDWIFTFVGANIDAVATSTSLGFFAAATSNYSTSNTLESYGAISDSVTRMKSMRSMGLSNHQIYESGTVYTAEDKTKMGG